MLIKCGCTIHANCSHTYVKQDDSDILHDLFFLFSQ